MKTVEFIENIVDPDTDLIAEIIYEARGFASESDADDDRTATLNRLNDSDFEIPEGYEIKDITCDAVHPALYPLIYWLYAIRILLKYIH